MRTVFKIKNSDGYVTNDITDLIEFYGDVFGYKDLLRFLDYHGKSDLIDVEHILKHDEEAYFEYLKDLYDFNENMTGFYGSFEEFKNDFTIEEFSIEDYCSILIELDEDIINMILNEIGVKFGTAGYSPWSYYLALENMSYDFIEDIYSGYNFYDISQYNESGDILDSVCLIYINNSTELIDALKDNFIFDVDDFIYLENNEVVEYFEHEKFKKVDSYYIKKFMI